MSPFAFRFQTLLQLRLSQRDQRRAELAEAYQAEQLLGQQTQQLADEVAQTREEVRRVAEPGPINVDQLLQNQRYELVLRARTQWMQQQNAQLAAEVERRRQALQEADQQVRMLEKLRDKQRHEQDQQQRQRETRHLDEVAQRRPENDFRI